MAIPITKKAASSCAKNMELNSIAMQVNDALIKGEGAIGESKAPIDVQAAYEGGAKDAMPKETTKEPSIEENLENEDNGGGAEE